jgi:hypothetical protein
MATYTNAKFMGHGVITVGGIYLSEVIEVFDLMGPRQPLALHQTLQETEFDVGILGSCLNRPSCKTNFFWMGLVSMCGAEYLWA